MKRLILILGILYLSVSLIRAQSEEDALRYSITNLVGTARYVGLGGAYGAIGADFTSLSSNPAGIGLYKKSEFSISPSIFFGGSESNYNGRVLDDKKNNFALGNVGVVISGSPTDRLDRNPMENYQFGFGLNRLNDYNNRVIIEGQNNQNSLLDTYLDYAGNQNPEWLNSFDTRPAFDTYLIDTLPETSPFTYINAYDYLGGFTSAIQRKTIETSGSMNEVVLSGGMNVDDRFYFGLTFGFPYFRYKQQSTYTEYNQTEQPDLDEFSVYESLETKGSGFNIKLGTIIKLTPMFRLGAAFHSPTWFNNVTDKWSTNTQAYYTNGDFFNASSPYGEYKYDIRTPWKASGSAAFMLGRMGFLSAEYEFVDYAKARLSPSADFSIENDVINENFTKTHNFRVGAEYLLGRMQVRGGYAYRMSPFVDGVNDASAHTFSGGLGYRTSGFFVDAALSYYMSDMTYYLYSSQNYSASSDLAYNNFNFVLTLGFRFD